MFDDVADFGNHQISGEVTVDLVDLFKAFGAVFDAGEHALGGLDEVGRAFVAFFQEAGFAGFEGIVNFLAFDGELLSILVELGKFSFELFDLHHEFGEVFFALVRVVTEVEVVDNRLTKQFHLGSELGSAFSFR